MRKSTRLLLVFVFSLSAALVSAQSGKNVSKRVKAKQIAADSSVIKTDTVIAVAPSTPPQEEEDTTRRKKDVQNQLQFMQPDMESKKYNFYDRRRISTPLMPRYDLDTAAYQSGKKRKKQQDAFLQRKYAFPAKPKDQWELSVNVGSALISGNVKPYLNGTGFFQNIGAGAAIRKAIGYVFSVRGGYTFMMCTGRNWEPDHNLKFNPALTGRYNPVVNYYNNPALNASKTLMGINMNQMFFHNYRIYIHEFHLEGVVNLGNIKFHKERNILNFYLFAGVSAFLSTTKVNALNKDGEVYDFSEPMSLYLDNNANTVNSRIKNQKKESLKLLNQIYDNTYESFAEHSNNKIGFKNWQFVPAGTFGGGVQFHVSKWVTLGLEERILVTQTDLDGYRWQQDEHASLVSHYDKALYTSFNVNIHLGGKKRTEPMYWLNPVYHSYRKLGEVEPQGMIDEVMKDDDEDGVPNYLDKEPNTKKGCPVDTHGVTLDSDHDGIPDCLDKEPYSPIGYPIDVDGAAIIPPNPCCDTTRPPVNYAPTQTPIPGNNFNNYVPPPANVPIIVPATESTAPGLSGGGGGGPKKSAYDCSKIELPSVMFDDDKYYLDPQYYGNLHQIAERMQMCPDVRLVVTGLDESRNDQKYNEQLGWNRANSAIDYLVEKYGVSRDRFIVKFIGGKKAFIGTAYERRMRSKVDFRYANEDENGDSNPPSPHPGLKAGSNK